MAMTREQKHEYVRDFLKTKKDIMLVDWEALGYNSPISAKSGFDIVLRRFPYHCRMTTKGIQLYLVTDEYYDANLDHSSERLWRKFKEKLTQAIEFGSGVLKIPRDSFPKGIMTFPLKQNILRIIRDFGYEGLYVDVGEEYIMIWKTNTDFPHN